MYRKKKVMLQTKDHHILYIEILLETLYLAVIGNFTIENVTKIICTWFSVD